MDANKLTGETVMKRRNFLKILAGNSLMTTIPMAIPGLISQAQAATNTLPWDGPVLITLNLGGGLDQSSWVDPRNDTDINHYAQNKRAGKAGNIFYAPLGDNKAFFEKYYDRILVANGLDLQTNSHSVARQNQYTGRLANGYPSIDALYAAIVGKGLPMPWLLFNGPSMGGSVQAYTRLTGDVNLSLLANPNLRNPKTVYFRSSDKNLIDLYRLERLQRLAQTPGNLPFEQRKLAQLFAARSNNSMFYQLQDILPDRFDFEGKGGTDSVLNDVHKALVSFSAGVSVAATFQARRGWDTHSAQDNKIDDNCAELTRILDYIWSKAEILGVADRLLVHVGSDVGRTPRYNSRNGKDHWSVTSTLLMMKNQRWTNRIVGISGPQHQKIAINPGTLQPDENGSRLRPAHVHRAIRQILNIDQHPLVQKFEFDEAEINLLNPANQSPLLV